MRLGCRVGSFRDSACRYGDDGWPWWRVPVGVGEWEREVSDDYAPLVGGWAFQRDFAVRSAGFPVSGLEVFGLGDETERIRSLARQPRFREAVTWQNPAALVNAVVNVAENAPTKPSRARGREEIVASYWQRYCAKNDTIGFFGPLAWGRIADDGPALRSRAGSLVRERAVHLEAWPVQALAEALDPQLKIAAGPFAEHDLRIAFEQHPDGGIRERGLAALDRLEAARDAVASSRPEHLLAALADLDAAFVELTGREPVRNAGRAYGARTLCYLDCMRDLDVTIGPALLDEIAPALQVLFEAGSWYCGRVNEIGRRVIERALPTGGHGPFLPVLMEALRTIMQLPPSWRTRSLSSSDASRRSSLIRIPRPSASAPRPSSPIGCPPGGTQRFIRSIFRSQHTTRPMS